MLIRKAYKFRLYPTPEQTKLLATQFGARALYITIFCMKGKRNTPKQEWD